MTGFSITDSKGFSIEFANGYRVSVQFGPGNYCQHHVGSMDYDKPRTERQWRAYDAETAIIAPSGKFLRHKDGEVQGWQSVSDVLATLAYAASLPPEELEP